MVWGSYTHITHLTSEGRSEAVIWPNSNPKKPSFSPFHALSENVYIWGGVLGSLRRYSTRRVKKTDNMPIVGPGL